jgi:hypothetical protein
MPGISNDDLLDLQATTLANLPNLDFEVALDYQNYPVCNQWFRGDKKQITSGTSIERNIILDTSGNARHVRLYQKTPINVTDVHHKVTCPWCQVQTHYSIERREALRNRAPARYIDLLKSRRLDAMLDLADLLEARAWATPSGADDDLNPRGLPYWLSFRENGVTSATDDGDFAAYTVRYGGGTTTTTKGGIDGSSQTKWRNYAAVYDAINVDFVERMRRAFHATGFVSPIMVTDLTKGPASKFRINMGLDPLVAYESLVTSANDNLGRDLDPFHGMTTFRRVPIIYTPVLDSLTVIDGGGNEASPEPVYGVNHNHFFPFVQEGDWLREDGPMRDVEQNNVNTTFVDSSYNYFCNNVRQAGFVLHKTIPSS